jgi:peptidoglycan hydrolase CwlO-like protein
MTNNSGDSISGAAQKLASKAPSWAVGAMIVIVSTVFIFGYTIKDTGLNTPLIKLIEAQTNASTDLTREVKGLTDTVKILIERVDKNQNEYVDLKKTTQARVDLIEKRVETLEVEVYRKSNTKTDK